jgi:hypothetical protein
MFELASSERDDGLPTRAPDPIHLKMDIIAADEPVQPGMANRLARTT